MRYHEAANFLLDLQRYRPKPGTASTADLLSWLDDPQDGPAFVQIAGSNGKGSTARMTERALREAGLDVGLYTSPHLDDYRERVRVNGRPIPERAVVDFVEAVKPRVNDRAGGNDAPTFFEVLTTLALWHFGREEVDIGVLEVGIGGRYDATSVVEPTASAVTSVTLEHTELLGDTVDEIARDKAQIVGEGPLVTGASGAALDAIVDEVGDVITISPASYADVTATYHGAVSPAEAAIDVAGPDWSVETNIPLLGEMQARNAGVAVTLVKEIAERGDLELDPIDDTTIECGLRSAHWPGRFEVMQSDPMVVLDGAHNPGGAAALAKTVAEFEYDDLHLVYGAMHDKDHEGIATALPSTATVTTCKPARERAEDQEVLAGVFDHNGAEVTAMSSVEAAVDSAIEGAGPEDLILVTGSLYTVAEARQRWARMYVDRRVDSIGEATASLERAHVTDAGIWRMRGKGVHRVVSTRVQQRQAQFLKEEMLSLGGECAISGLNDQHEGYLDVVLMGTLAQFKRLIEKLEGQPYGLSMFADSLRRALDIQVQSAPQGYPWEEGTAVMGILNVTPDSFHDGGEYEQLADAIDRGREMISAGATIIDVGGESTRPGADPVPAKQEQERVLPVIEALADQIDERSADQADERTGRDRAGGDVLLSIDTRKADVARAALETGADMVNDVSGLADPEMRFVAAEHDAPLVVMHSIETPVDPDRRVEYDDVVDDVLSTLRERVLLAERAGLDRSQIVVDPGLGFGKSPAESFELLGRIGEFAALGTPVMVGHSHKSMFEAMGRGPEERHDATTAASALAADRGADIIRVHDVEATVDAVRTVRSADRIQD